MCPPTRSLKAHRRGFAALHGVNLANAPGETHLEDTGVTPDEARITLTDPLGYLRFLRLESWDRFSS